MAGADAGALPAVYGMLRKYSIGQAGDELRGVLHVEILLEVWRYVPHELPPPPQLARWYSFNLQVNLQVVLQFYFYLFECALTS